MIKWIRFLIVYSLLIGVISCNKSTEKINTISDVKAEIGISQSLSDKNENTVLITLYDKEGKEIGNDSINVFVNQKKANYTIQQNLYYTKNYYYRIENIQPEDDKYEVEIQLISGKKFFLGSINTLKLSDDNKIICPEEAPLEKDFTIKWSDLHDINILILSKTVQILKKQEPNITTFSEQNGDTIKINPTGNYTIKKEKFSKSNEKLSIMVFTFDAQKTGTVNPELIKGSSITINGSHEKEVHFK